MKHCDDCKWANWKRTVTGRLHPDKTGRCTFVVRIPVLPLAFRWGHGTGSTPNLGGGYIERKHDFPDHCPTWAQKDSTTYTIAALKRVEVAE